MSEKEIRGILQDVCAELDRRVRQAVTLGVRKVLLPTALGAGLALSSGCSDDRTVPNGDATSQTDGSSTQTDGGAVPPYSAPGPDAGIDGGPVIEYMAPDDGGAVPPYMAPDAGIDTGPVIEYMAPDDSGAVPPYMAPQPDGFGIDSDPTLDYMAPDPS